MLRALIVARTEIAPFQPAPTKAAGGEVPLYENLGKLSFKISVTKPAAQAYFDQGLRLLVNFNHAEAQRSFHSAQRADPNCAMCYWGETLALGPNINAPMVPEANAPALAALERASALKNKAAEKERALIEAMEKRYSSDPKADRAALDAAYADAMKAVAARFPRDATVQTLYAEAAMDTQPWDYWEEGAPSEGARCRHRAHAGGRAGSRSGASPCDPSLHPRGRGFDSTGKGLALRETAGRANARCRPHCSHAVAHLLPHRHVP